MKQLSLIFILLPSLSYAYFSPVVSAVTHPQDLQYITNLAYWSYKRHRANYKAQKVTFENLQESWHLWQSTTKLCLNPAHYPLLAHSTTLPQQSLDIFKQLRIANTAYTHALTHVLRNTQSIQAREYITHTRTQARYKSARVILTYLLTHATEFLQKTKAPKTLTDISSFGALLFGKTDKNYTQVSDTLWQKFLVTQKLHNGLWLSIEQARAQFYLKQYTQCFAALHTLTQERAYHTLVINEHGVTLDSRSTAPLLPHPEQSIE